jgi:membrane protein insertase Oxa1/YidC/SpoIIIJ
MRAQKAQNQFSSVDGQQAQTQKTTMIIMTVMFGIFAFMYSTAFSIYMVTSSVFSLFSTMIINKLVDNSMNKAEAAKLREKYTRKLPGQKTVETDNRKKKK